MHVDVTKEHKWLQKLVGEWRTETECPGEPSSNEKGTSTMRALGEVWIVTEGSGDMPDGCCSFITMLGYDPEKQAFVGTRVASVMTQIVHLSGSLNAEETVLTLDSEGPSFSGEGLAKYQDVIEMVDEEHWIHHSQIQLEDGEWVRFMTTHHYRA